ncbi:MAG: NAD(+) diphosphatase [Clostridia bacterium]|nr:NAD(+) diphosphatase [Clostridia bacterium]
MIQDIAPYKLDNAFRIQEPEKDDYLVFVSGRMILLKKEEDKIVLPQIKDLGEENIKTDYLFSVSERAFFMLSEENEKNRIDGIIKKFMEDGYSYQPMAALRSCNPRWICYAAATACHIASWYQSNRFCGSCGRPMKKSTEERMVYCEHCHQTVYPKISPVAIVGIVSRDKILLTRYADKSHSARYALVAGFMEVGETAEEAVKREVMEETGLKVKNLHYYKSQPWAFSDSLLFGFFCEVEGSENFHFDDNELSYAKWALPEEMPQEPEQLSLTYEMMDQFRLKGRAVLGEQSHISSSAPLRQHYR